MKGFFAYPVLLILLFGTSACADLQKANDTIESGDYTTALKELKPLAEQGQADAQYNLGLMYSNGWGVVQNYKAAVKWYKLAAEQSDADSVYRHH